MPLLPPFPPFNSNSFLVQDASIRHSGDNLTGAGDGDDGMPTLSVGARVHVDGVDTPPFPPFFSEQIVIDLLKLPARVESCYLIVNSYR